MGHLEGLYHIFEDLRKHEMSRLVFDILKKQVDESAFVLGMTDWNGFYEGIQEEFSPGMPELLGKITHTR